MKKILRGLLVVVVLLVICFVLVLGLLGFIPGISSVFGSNKPRNLGVTFTERDHDNAYKKNGVAAFPILASSDITDSIRYEGEKEIIFSMNSAEITALINNNDWKYMPISHVQIRVDNDNGEVSGILHIDKILPFISLTHSTDQVKTAMKKYHIAGNPPFYVKGKVLVTNNQVTLKPEKVEIGRLTIPAFLIDQNISALTDFIERRIANVPNLLIRSLRLYNNSVNFNGTVPEKEFKAEK
ncbi:MAG: hypothetical protein WC775_04150 [Patescibacteria group bacterium]|jgi:hypothetical protein